MLQEDKVVPTHTCENSLIKHPGERGEIGVRAGRAQAPQVQGASLQVPSVTVTRVPRPTCTATAEDLGPGLAACGQERA